MSLSVIGLFVLGFALLVLGGEWLVRGSSRLALALGITPLVIGLTVVAFGTSAPELAVSVIATLDDQGGLAVGNVLGSNIANLLLILGASAVVAPLAVARSLIRLDIPLMIGASVLAWVMSFTGVLSRTNGLILVGLLIGYTAFSIYKSRSETQMVQREYENEFGSNEGEDLTSLSTIVVDFLLIGAGIGLLVLGSRWVVNAASEVARHFGISDLVIGLSIVAVGTSLPELATSIVAALKGERDIAVGNVVGSNLFNILCVLGVTATVLPGGIPVPPEAIRFDFPVMILVSVVVIPVMFSGLGIERWEGALFLLGYVGYIAHLILLATRHPYLGRFEMIVGWFILPIVGLIIVAHTVRTFRQLRSG